MFCTYGQESSEFIHHIVKKGENVYRLSIRYKVPVDSIKKWNYLNQNYLIIEGMRLIIRRPQTKPQEKRISQGYDNQLNNVLDNRSAKRYHIVAVKENVFRISLRYHVPVDSISIWNNLNPDFTILVGQRLIVSGRK
jgi:LysM repeat protein